MDTSRARTSAWRGAVVAVGSSLGAGLAQCWLAADARLLLGSLRDGSIARTPFDALLPQVLAVVAMTALAWLWWCALVAAVDAVRGRPELRRGHPAWLRRVVLAVCGATLLATAPAATALAVGTEDGRDPGPRDLLDGLASPAAPLNGSTRDAPAERPRESGPTGVPAPASYVVAPGDSLWSIAAAHLTADATDARIAASWRAIYRDNRTRVGADPDLIRVGVRLRLPRLAPLSAPGARR